MQPPFCLIQKLKRSSAENSRRPETLVVELSLSLLRRLSSLLSLSPARRSLSPRRRSLSSPSLSLSSPSHALSLLAGAVWWWGDRISISSPLSLVSRSGSRSRLRWSVLNPSCSHVLYTPLCWS
ncbi:hypothetical protein F2Q68_00008270 [Brassica cretica]|uniref:Uncharacterized protein n=1 Tax=Brassica cretica TaxID=69181 RepID=A0A8S9KYR7_BRACR|nr:hypothetical protein F2Q68_00008270 [Brassica cretica]